MSNDVTISVKTNDQASQGLDKIAGNTENMTQRAGKSISGLGQKIGGEFGEIVTHAGESLEEFGEHGQSAAKKLTIASAAVAGAGIALMAFGSGAKQSAQQLDAAINATGASAEDFAGQIDQVKSKAEDLGHSGIDAENALNTLVVKTGDAAKAFQYMGLVEDLAAQKHISLASAADLVAKALDGNTKLFKTYGIDVAAGALSVDQLNGYLVELQQHLSGQAAASVDSFSGRIDALRQHVVASAEDFANKYGPAISAAGTVATVVSTGLDILAARSVRATGAVGALAVANTVEGTSAAGAAVANAGVAASEDALAASAGEASAASLGLAASLGPVGVAGALFAVALAMSPVGKEIKNLITGSSDLGGSLATTTQLGQALSRAMQQDGGTMGAFTRQAVAAQYQLDVTSASITKAGLGVGEITTALTESDAEWNTQIVTWTAAHGLNKQQVATLQNMKDVYDSVVGSINDATTATTALYKSDLDLATAAEQVVDANMSAGQSADTFMGALQGLTKSVDDAKAAHDAQATSLDTSTAAGLKNHQNLLSLIDDNEKQYNANLKAGMSVGQATELYNHNSDAIQGTATAAGISATAVAALIAQYKLTPAVLATKAQLDDYDARVALEKWERDLAAAPTNFTAHFNVSQGEAAQKGYSHGGIPGAATGGNRNGVIQWAENGREMAKLPNGSYVMSNPDTERALASGGGSPTIEVHIHTDGSAMAAGFVKGLRYEVRVQGGNVQKVLGQG